MMTNDRDAYRKIFFSIWDKYKKKSLLDAEENKLLEIMLAHPEYHKIFENPKGFLEQEFEVEENPFLHMSLHSAIREQVKSDLPAGIAGVYKGLRINHPEGLEAEHLMMGCLIAMMKKAQEMGKMPEDSEYLRLLKKLV